MTTFTIEVYPNTACVSKYDNLNITCQLGSFCSFTIQHDYFQETENEDLFYSLNEKSESEWLNWSDMNGTIFGLPT